MNASIASNFRVVGTQNKNILLFHFTEAYYKEMLSWQNKLEEEKTYFADLDKLPKDRKQTLIDMGEFGVDGSFQKLDLD